MDKDQVIFYLKKTFLTILIGFVMVVWVKSFGMNDEAVVVNFFAIVCMALYYLKCVWTQKCDFVESVLFVPFQEKISSHLGLNISKQNMIVLGISFLIWGFMMEPLLWNILESFSFDYHNRDVDVRNVLLFPNYLYVVALFYGNKTKKISLVK